MQVREQAVLLQYMLRQAAVVPLQSSNREHGLQWFVESERIVETDFNCMLDSEILPFHDAHCDRAGRSGKLSSIDIPSPVSFNSQTLVSDACRFSTAQSARELDLGSSTGGPHPDCRCRGGHVRRQSRSLER